MWLCFFLSIKTSFLTMAAEFTQEAILDFLKANGGKVKHTDLTEHFKASFPEEPGQKTAARKTFKNYVDNIAFVKAESEVKYVCLKKKFRWGEKEPLDGTGSASRYPAVSDSRQVAGHGAVESRASGREALPGSGDGSDSQVGVPCVFNAATISPENNGERTEFVCVVEETSCSGEMGNRESFKREKRLSEKAIGPSGVGIPEIAVIQASPLPAEESVFVLPGPAQTGTTRQVDTGTAGLDPGDIPVESHVVMRQRDSKASSFVSRQLESDDWEDEGQLDLHSLNGSPTASRRLFIETMMSSSSQVRRSLVQRGSVHLSSRNDSDSASMVSSNPDDERTLVTLDPLEHEWMMCASDGEWGSLRHLLAEEPSLVLRKDFVTGFTGLHWAAKQGKPELMALMINFAKQNDVPISVDVRSNTGYTPLHVAAMHNHMEVVKLLVGAYNADVDIRDYSGRKACQYLTDNTSVDIQDIIGAYEHLDSKNTEQTGRGSWRFSKVLQSNLKPLRLHEDFVDGEVGPREKVLRRKSSLSRMKPKLQRLRVRASQIVHSTTFHDTDEQEGSTKGSFRSRPKTHFFG